MLLCRDGHHDGISAVLLGDEPVLHQLLLDALGICPGLIDLVDGDDDRHIRRLRVVDCLDRLRHHAVIRRDHEDRNVRDLRTARTHCCKRLMSRRIEEDNLLPLTDDLIGTNVLRDAARLMCADRGIADGVEQRRLAVIDVTHDRNDGRTLLQRLRIVHDLGDQRRIDIRRQFLGGDTELPCHKRCRIEVNLLIDARHDAHEHELFDDVRCGVAHLGCEILDGNRLRQLDVLRPRDLHLCCGSRRCSAASSLAPLACAAAAAVVLTQVAALLTIAARAATPAASAIRARTAFIVATAAASAALTASLRRRHRRHCRCCCRACTTGAPCRTGAAARRAARCPCTAPTLRRLGRSLGRCLPNDDDAGRLRTRTKNRALLLLSGHTRSLYLRLFCRLFRVVSLLSRLLGRSRLRCRRFRCCLARQRLLTHGLRRTSELRLDGCALLLTDGTEHIFYFVVLALQDVNNGTFVRLKFLRQIGDSVFRF